MTDNVSNHPLRHRREIDGLRALAVLPVLFFHAGSSTFSGGFVGVDVFFVISGYLITSMILAELVDGRFSFARFYERRARRILPALVLVVSATIPAAWLWLPPDRLLEYARSLAGVGLMASNVVFWSESGYFGSAAELQPLLHTWSLAIEEQYYVLFPVALLLLWRFGRARVEVVLWVGTLASLILAHLLAGRSPAATFFLLPTRAWELLLGALTASYLFHRGPPNTRLAPALGVVGLAMLCTSILVFDEHTPFPSAYALLPTLATVLIIVCARPGTAAGALLSTTPLVAVGLISYSAYLWHQPVLAFLRTRTLGEPSDVAMGTGLALSLVAAALSWRYVEQPFRDRSRFTRRQVLTGALIASLTLVAFGAVGALNEGFPGRFGLSEQLVKSFELSRRKEACYGRETVEETVEGACRLGRDGLAPSFLVAGDSHALSLFDAFHEAASSAGRAGIFVAVSGCTPLLGIHALRKGQEKVRCFDVNNAVRDLVEREAIADIYFVARWNYYTVGGYEGRGFSHIGLTPSTTRSPANSQRAFQEGLARTLDTYRRLGVTVHAVEQVPLQRFDAKTLYYQMAASGYAAAPDEAIRRLSVNREDHRRLSRYVLDTFSSNQAAGQLNVVKVAPALCDDEVCPFGAADRSFYFDDNHLSVEGARQLVDTLEGALLQGRPPGRSLPGTPVAPPPAVPSP
jgi:peptidoglycan/LPS O-acetylase OafA/YrhL